MKSDYIKPDIIVIGLASEQCILSGSSNGNVPGLEPGTDFDELLD